LQEVQRRFEIFAGLELDFSFFKVDYFNAKNSKDCFLREYLKRNEPNRRIIAQYMDDFYLFQKKKANKENRRSNLLPTQNSSTPSGDTRPWATLPSTPSDLFANRPTMSLSPPRTDWSSRSKEGECHKGTTVVQRSRKKAGASPYRRSRAASCS
jgi:hypothetical protein